MLFSSKRDPRDTLIEQLTSERDHLRALVAQLQDKLVALTDAHAFRLLHPHDGVPRPPAKPAEPSPFERRSMVHIPQDSLAKLEAKATGRIVD